MGLLVTAVLFENVCFISFRHSKNRPCQAFRKVSSKPGLKSRNGKTNSPFHVSFTI